MKTITFAEFKALNIKQLVTTSFDKADNAITGIHKVHDNASDWIAVPMREEIYDNECMNLANYSLRNNIKTIYGLSGLYAKKINAVLKGNATIVNFAHIESEHALETYVILPDTGGFQIASDGDYYTVFIGPKEFVSSVLVFSIDETIQRLTKYMESYKNKDKNVYGCLSKVLNACNEFNAKR